MMRYPEVVERDEEIARCERVVTTNTGWMEKKVADRSSNVRGTCEREDEREKASRSEERAANDGCICSVATTFW